MEREAAINRCKAFFPLLLAFLCACGADAGLRRPKKDVYPDFQALASAHVEGRDYSREVYNRNSPVSVFAIHGGDIETATSRLARNIAGADFNLYIFNGWLGPDSGKLHITSVNFDDPQALALSSGGVFAVSLHVQADRGQWVCVGGAAPEAGRLVAAALYAAGFAAEAPCRKLPGVNPRNIVNRGRLGGMQLEITPRLCKRLETSPADLAKFTGAVRNSIFEALKKEKKDERLWRP
ncbi:MAG: poly-gamma-glutamate hydrolase family protein [Elusimicrobia bacterium]|nr:poly-gamma-glutamate hydrolase family protein [Elusimicrobiota bacterium]